MAEWRGEEDVLNWIERDGRGLDGLRIALASGVITGNKKILADLYLAKQDEQGELVQQTFENEHTKRQTDAAEHANSIARWAFGISIIALFVSIASLLNG